MINKEM